MIFEVTRNYTIIVPLMISNLIAFYIAHWLQQEPIYEALARQDGLHLPGGSLRRVASQLQVRTALQSGPTPLAVDMSLAEAHHRMTGSDFDSWPVVDDMGLVGMLRSADVAAAMSRGRATAPLHELLNDEASVPAGDDEFPHVHADQPLGLALARMGGSGHSVLPVVSRANARTLLGVVTLGDVLKAYGVAHRDGEAVGVENNHDEIVVDSI
jgi:CIC family chloride channel protein